MSIVSMAGAVLLLATEASLSTTTDAVDQTIADGLARQLLDELLTQRYVAPGSVGTSTGIGPNAWEAAGNGRERFNDADDYHGLSVMPAEDYWGRPLGSGDSVGNLRHPAFRLPTGTFSRWRQRVEVYFVSATDHSVRLVGQTSNYRAVEVTIERVAADGSVERLANLRRTMAYVAPPSY